MSIATDATDAVIWKVTTMPHVVIAEAPVIQGQKLEPNVAGIARTDTSRKPARVAMVHAEQSVRDVTDMPTSNPAVLGVKDTEKYM